MNILHATEKRVEHLALQPSKAKRFKARELYAKTPGSFSEFWPGVPPPRSVQKYLTAPHPTPPTMLMRALASPKDILPPTCTETGLDTKYVGAELEQEDKKETNGLSRFQYCSVLWRDPVDSK